MELHEYTDEQLREELKRRTKIKIEKSRAERKANPYIYWEGEVVNCYDQHWGSISTRYTFGIKNDELIHPTIKTVKATLLQGVGFTQTNMPKVGDKVKLRYKNGNGMTCNIRHSKIVEIINTHNNESNN